MFGIKEMGTNAFQRLLLPPPAGGPPPSMREVWGASRALSKFLIQSRVQGRNPARFNGGYGVPRGFKGGSKPSAPCGRLSEAEHPKRKGATLLRPLSAVNSKSPPNPLGLAERGYSFHRPQGGPPPSMREVWGWENREFAEYRRARDARTPSTAAAVPLPRRGRSLERGIATIGCIIATVRCICNRRLHRRTP